MDYKEITLDVRNLEHPEPFEMAVAAMEELRPEDGSKALKYVRMIHRREPFPLYELLDKKGFRRKTITLNESLFNIIFWDPANPEPKDGEV